MTDKLSDKDKKDWQNFLNSSDKLENKDQDILKKNKVPEKSIDLHGFTLEEANKKISDFIGPHARKARFWPILVRGDNAWSGRYEKYQGNDYPLF